MGELIDLLLGEPFCNLLRLAGAVHQLGDVGRRIRIVLAHRSPPISKLLGASIPTAGLPHVELMCGVGDYNYTKTLQRMSDSDTYPVFGTFQSYCSIVI